MSIGLHNLKPNPGARSHSKRLGRGNASGKGTTAGKGTKGQRARQGGRKGLRGLGMKFMIQSTPKLGGFTSLYKKPATLPISSLNAFKDGATISLKTLADAGLVAYSVTAAKLVGGGKLVRKLVVKKIGATESAKKQIESAGGTFTA